MEKIEIKDIGPVKELSFQLEGYGLTVLSARNGRGKSIILDAIQKAALGKGKLPLRDGARRGMVDCCGAIITVGQVTRHTGEFQVENLESRLPLAQLVDPQIAKPDAADRARIKALVALTGVTASRELFTSHPAFADFAENVGEDATKTDDLVEMAARVKRDYEAMARDAERKADREEGHVRGLEEAAAGVDLTVESDAEKLQAAYNAARDECTAIVAGQAEADKIATAIVSAKQRLAELASRDGVMPVDEADEAYKIASDTASEHAAHLAALKEQVRKAEAAQQVLEEKLNTAAAARDMAHVHEDAVAKLKATIAECGEPAAPGGLVEAQAAMAAAKTALEAGVIVRDAKEKLASAASHKEAAAKLRKQSERLREAANCVDEVLSNAIHCERLKIASVDGVARLVVDHPVRGENVPYGDLSMGERWRIAIDLGADLVGEDGLLVIPQDAYEALDAFVRPEIHQHAVERKCYVLTAEATRDKADGDEITAKQFAASA